MDLNTIMFIYVTFLFIGFFFLEGFDYGVGILLPFIGKNDTEQRVMLNAIGPVWDANEVWMITAGAILFGSFPHVYASLFSGFYLALILMLVALIVRGTGFEFRSKVDSQAWRTTWNWLIFAGSLLPALLWGVAVGNLMRGIALDESMTYYGGLLPLLNPFSLLCGLVFVCLFAIHGANYLSLKTAGEVAKRAKKVAFTAWLVTTVLIVIFVLWTFFATDILTKAGVNGMLPALLATLALLAGGYFIRFHKWGWAFVMVGLVVVFATIMVFSGLYPRILISTTNPDYNLTIYNAASTARTLKLIATIATIMLPIILAYKAMAYWIFRQRVEPKAEALKY
jgi:cytochrome d ubiquinol oxidase subunit II